MPEYHLNEVGRYKVCPVAPPNLGIEALQGNAQAQYEMGKKSEARSNLSEAATWYLRAARQGHAGAQRKLREMYGKGKGVGEDISKALDYFFDAAAQGNTEAQLTLWEMYLYGEGVDKDLKEALGYLM
ncbi:MAG: tetratricopeptide repeat protein, partial [Bacteroidota bacterium]